MAGRFIAAEICQSFLTQPTCFLTQALATLYPIPSPLHLHPSTEEEEEEEEFIRIQRIL